MLRFAKKKLNGVRKSLLGFKNTARTTREFPTDAMIVINIEDAAVEKDKYVGAVMLSHGYFPIRDIFGSYLFRVKTVSGISSCISLLVVIFGSRNSFSFTVTGNRCSVYLYWSVKCNCVTIVTTYSKRL